MADQLAFGGEQTPHADGSASWVDRALAAPDRVIGGRTTDRSGPTPGPSRTPAEMVEVIRRRGAAGRRAHLARMDAKAES